MAKVVWSVTSIENIEEIMEYISKDSATYAERVAAKIYNRAQVLENYPLSGRVVPELSDNAIRELIEGNYRIIYELVSETEVLNLTVHHSARQL